MDCCRASGGVSARPVRESISADEEPGSIARPRAKTSQADGFRLPLWARQRHGKRAKLARSAERWVLGGPEAAAWRKSLEDRRALGGELFNGCHMGADANNCDCRRLAGWPAAGGQINNGPSLLRDKQSKFVHAFASEPVGLFQPTGCHFGRRRRCKMSPAICLGQPRAASRPAS